MDAHCCNYSNIPTVLHKIRYFSMVKNVQKTNSLRDFIKVRILILAMMRMSLHMFPNAVAIYII